MAGRTVTAALAIAVALAAVGCNLTRQNYEAVSLGLPADEVRRILGAPRYEFDDEWVYTQDDPRDLTKVSIYFDKETNVVGKCWQNPEKPWENQKEGRVP